MKKYVFCFCFDCGAAVDADAIKCENCNAQQDAQRQWIEGVFKNDVSTVLGVIGKEIEVGDSE